MVIKQLLASAAVVMLASLAVSVDGFDDEFTFYKLSLIWPSSVCRVANCKTPIPTFFTIHGLWPTFADDKPVPPYNKDTNKCNANPTAPDDIAAKLIPIEGQLKRMWPNLWVNKSDLDFWKIEWQHHGMCSNYPQDPFGYFNDTLSLSQSSLYNPLKVMGIQPSDTNSYKVKDILENVYTKLGAYPQIACSMPKKDTLWLKEIRFCFKRTKKTPPSVAQSCPNKVGDRCTDPENDIVWFLPPTSGVEIM